MAFILTCPELLTRRSESHTAPRVKQAGNDFALQGRTPGIGIWIGSALQREWGWGKL